MRLLFLPIAMSISSFAYAAREAASFWCLISQSSFAAHSKLACMKIYFLSGLILVFSSIALGDTKNFPPNAFENETITEMIQLMDQHLLGMKCGTLTKRVQASTEEYLQVKHETTGVGICTRKDLPNESRPYFRSIMFEAVIEFFRSTPIVSLEAKYPIDYRISDQGSIDFFEALAKHFEKKFLSGYLQDGKDFNNIKSGRGSIMRWYVKRGVFFQMELRLDSDEKSPNSTKVKLITNWDA